MPAIVFSGSTYSDNPAHRMWIANGQVFHEGEDIAPGVRLERIEPKSAVIRFQGQLYVWRD